MATKKTTDTPAKSATKTASKTASKSPAKVLASSAAITPAKKSVASETAAPKPAAADTKAPTHEEISQLAHQYWKERGHHHGSHEDDWSRAERELKARS